MKKILIFVLLFLLVGCGNEVKTYREYNDGDILYFNPTTGEECYADEVNSKTGTKNGCMKWYVFNDSKTNSYVNLLLDHNTTALVPRVDNYEEENEVALKQLKKDTKDWKMKYRQFARFIKVKEIEKIIDKEITDITILDENCIDYKNYKVNKYSWLFENTCDCYIGGCTVEETDCYSNLVLGYWTNDYNSDDGLAYAVISNGSIINEMGPSRYMGIRPVISVSKKIF